MTTYIREPIPVYLRQDQYEALQARAEHDGVSVEDLIRQGVDALLFNGSASHDDDTAQAGWPDDAPIEEHPLWGVVGLGDAGVSDLAENHDKYLVEFELKSNGQWPEKSS